MSFGGGGHGNLPGQPGWAFPSDPEDEAEQTFEFRRVPTGEGFQRMPPEDEFRRMAPDGRFGQAPPEDGLRQPAPGGGYGGFGQAAPGGGFRQAPPEDGFRPVAPEDGFWQASPGDGFRQMAPDDYRAQVGRTIPPRAHARTTRNMRRPPGRRPGRIWLLAGGIAVPVAAGIVIGVLVAAPGSTPAGHTGTLEEHAPSPGHSAATTSPAASTSPAAVANPGPGASANCPVGTSPTATAIANVLARDPVYAQPGAGLLTPLQARRLRAEIGRQDPGRIRIAALSPATVRQGGGERVLANAIASCPGTAPGTTLVTTSTATYLVTSYAHPGQASQAVAAALNTHVSLAAGLMDAVRRVTIVDKANR